ncbi:MAG: sugar phosphate nucleotidyltransferase [Patescibacteria group bacterium]
MKGIVLAGGTGSRLFPLTKVTNKHLLPVYDKPMIYYPLETMKRAGVDNILLISGRGHAGHFLEMLGNGKSLGVKLSYAVQEEPGGIAQALGLAEDFADNEKVIVILGDNIIQDNIVQAVKDFDVQLRGAKIFLKEVHNPSSFGVAYIKKRTIEKIVEKPKKPESNLAVVGIYMYDNQVFKYIKTLKPSKRGELEITDVNNKYVKDGTMTFSILKGWWGDGGESFDSLLAASNLVAQQKKKQQLH